jgi:hypothetical protein
MNLSTCTQCSTVFEYEGELPRRGSICFACHVKTIRLGFTYGKDNFHGDTIGERQRKTVEDAKINGYDAVPVGSRWI